MSLWMYCILYMYSTVNCVNNYLSFCLQTEPIKLGADATEYVWHLSTYRIHIPEIQINFLHSVSTEVCIDVGVLMCVEGRGYRRCVCACVARAVVQQPRLPAPPTPPPSPGISPICCPLGLFSCWAGSATMLNTYTVFSGQSKDKLNSLVRDQNIQKKNPKQTK